jgi:HTH-type transcriptional regulator/antitoxin HigA
MFNIISRKTILAYCKKHRDASSALKQWYHFIKYMKIRVIKNKKQHKEYLQRVDILLNKKVKKNTPEGEELELLLLLIEHYENEYFQIEFPDPIDVIKLKMLEKGIRNKDLVGKIGSKGYISSILNKKKPLTLDAAKIFKAELGISANLILY